MAIALFYRQLGGLIAEHYNNETTDAAVPTSDEDHASSFSEDSPSVVDGENDVDTVWRAYKAGGEAIARYYESKGHMIEEMYASMYKDHDKEDDNDDDFVDAVDGDWNTTILGGTKNGTLSANLLKDLTLRGRDIGDYYQARYDPDYKTKALGRLPQHDPNLDYPPWGVDPIADRAHGIAIGAYWKKYNHVMKRYYKMQGPALGTYYEGYYRSMFDPTFLAAGTAAAAAAGKDGTW